MDAGWPLQKRGQYITQVRRNGEEMRGTSKDAIIAALKVRPGLHRASESGGRREDSLVTAVAVFTGSGFQF